MRDVRHASLPGLTAYVRVRVINQAGGDLHNVTAALLFHLGDGELGDAEEASDIDAQQRPRQL